MRNHTEILYWDSSFFKKKIAKIVIYDFDINYITENLLVYKNKKIDLVYLFLENNLLLPTDIRSLYCCHLVDSRMTYSIEIKDTVYPTSPHIISYKGPSSSLYFLALQAGMHSRYKTDSHFSEREFIKLYTTWVDNSINHTIANEIFVYKFEQDINGFITIQIKNDTAGIGLIATDLKCRKQGIGSSLLNAAKEYARQNCVSLLNVATQKENKEACSFYEKNEFSLTSCSNIYHVWLNP